MGEGHPVGGHQGAMTLAILAWIWAVIEDASEAWARVQDDVASLHELLTYPGW